MSEILNLKPLFDAQKALDATIHEQHQTNYAKTHDDRVLALLVELGELANTTRCFKFWSLKGSEVEAIVLDEYADALHFLLSIGIMHGFVYDEQPLTHFAGTLTAGFLHIYHAVEVLRAEMNLVNYKKLFIAFTSIIFLLGANAVKIEEAYRKKLAVNYQRQEQKY